MISTPFSGEYKKNVEVTKVAELSDDVTHE